VNIEAVPDLSEGLHVVLARMRDMVGVLMEGKELVKTEPDNETVNRATFILEILDKVLFCLKIPSRMASDLTGF